MNVIGRDGDTLGIDSAQVGVSEETDKVSLRSLLKGHDGGGLETQVSLEVLSDLTDKTLEGQLADQKLSGLLVTTDLTESDGTGPVTMGFLDTSGGGDALTGSLGSQLFTGGFASGRFTGGLLGTGHLISSNSKERMITVRESQLAFICRSAHERRRKTWRAARHNFCSESTKRAGFHSCQTRADFHYYN